MLKKILIVLSLLLLTACRPASATLNTDYSYSVLSVKGIPSLALLNVYDDIVLSTNDDIENAFENKSYDVIIAPIDTGIKKAKESSDYKLLAVVTYGNYNIVSIDDSFSRGEVAVYKSDTVIEKLIDYLQSELSSYDFVWYDSYDEIKNGLNDGTISAALLSENDYLNLGIELVKIEDINELYTYKSTYENIPTYGMFVLSDIVNNYQDNLADFTKKIRSGVSQCKNDNTTLNNLLDKLDISEIGFDNKELILNHFSEIGVDFAYAVNEYDSIKNILDICDVDINENMIVK